MINMFGLIIVPHKMAVEFSYEFVVEPWPIRKRRRNWRVVKRSIYKPAAWKVGNVIYAHPDIFEMIKTYITEAQHIPDRQHQRT